LYEVAAAGYQFMVLPDVFLFHMDHPSDRPANFQTDRYWQELEVYRTAKNMFFEVVYVC
jgi:GT2 family glycosyltransferase